MTIEKSLNIAPLVGLAMTLLVLAVVENSLLILGVLLVAWWVIFKPFQREDLVVALISGTFFLLQNYSVLSQGGFEFSKKDFLLMPFYEPFLWGFYFLFLRRILPSGSRGGDLKKGIVGLLLTVVAFSAFSQHSTHLTLATAVSTTLLFLLYHSRADIMIAFTALGLGGVVELFGVSTGLWKYPQPDWFGLPWWFITMWLSVGLLGRNFLFPLAEKVAGVLSKHSD